MNSVKFSVIIPCYNCEKYIQKTINSIINQRTSDIEIIFVDDGSTDDTIKKIKNFMYEKNIEFKIINKKNEGVSIARNIGIEHATGDYIYFLDSDDYIEPYLFKKVKKIMVENPSLDAIAFGYNRVNENRVFWRYKDYFQYPERDIKGNEVCKLYLSHFLTLHLCSVILKTSIIKDNEVRFNDKCYYGEDVEFLMKTLIHCKEIKFIKEELFNYYDRDDSVIKKFSEKRFTGIDAMKRIKETFKSNPNSNNEEYEYLINKRLVTEYVYVYQSYVYYGDKNDIGMKTKINRMILENLDLIKSFSVDSVYDKEINKYIKYMINKPIHYAFYLDKKRKIKIIIKKNIKKLINKV